MSKKTLVIVESPAKGKKIQSYLGKDYVVKASVGHIADLAKGGPHNMGIDIYNNFKTRYEILPDKLDVIEDITNGIEEYKEILLCGDNDREGLAISMHLYSRLKKYGIPFKRVVFNEITKKGIETGLKNSQEITSKENMNMFHAQECRRILDRIVGFMASPYLMQTFNSNLSAGRVQSVITELVVDREQEIEAFEPETYYVLKSCLTKDNKEFFWAKVEEKITDEARAKEIKELLSGSNLDAKYTVSKVEADEKLREPDAPMITSQLQKVMSKSFGMKPDVTMKNAQTLYEQGYLTYIRTDSVRTDPDAIVAVRDYIKDQGYPLPKKARIFKTKDAAQDAHECIRPTDLNLTPGNSDFTGDEKKVYDVVWKSFVASQMEPAVYNTLKVSMKVKGLKSELKASGKALKSKGFLEIMGFDDNSKIEIPNLIKGEELSLFGKNPVSLEKKQTQAPARYSNSSLIEVLEKKEIGRPATYAEVLSKITARGYVDMEGTSTYKPTELGIKITQALSKSFGFMEYNYTAELEKKLDEIAAGKLDHIKMLNDFFKPFQEELSKAYVASGSDLCEKCKSPMKIRQSKSGDKFLGCSSYPNCYNTKPMKDESAA